MSQEDTHRHDPRFGKNTTGLGIVVVALVVVLLAIIAWCLWNKAKKEADHYRFAMEQTDGHESSGHAETGKPTQLLALGSLDSLGNFIYDVGDSIDLELPNGTKFRAGKNSTEAKLFDFLQDKSIQVDSVDKTKGWITSDRIFFESGKAKLTEASLLQIGNIAAILNAFPDAALKIGGYTDNTGDSLVNLRISQQRADMVMSAIKKQAVKNEMQAEGYGQNHPIADNSSVEGRAMNRRVDLRVTKK